ncbi:ATP-binding protein [Streptomyces edwardsiae]|uniref:ATP-binding protein n=1 Tax=Streptomyces edwardsiae TaxID=3075527 RepID=A0ABU2Q280_9ACTN|nr:ATP-binding protein [Streptomyces sp. DSM 41636]MDT0397625.1 ATP-binding protein [Streptomyces sp. DSM 41636]
MPTKVIRSPEGKERPRDAPWYTLYPRRWLTRTAGVVGRRWRTFRTDREARKSIVPNRSWHPWRLSLGRLLRVFAFLGTALLITWVMLKAFHPSWFETLSKNDAVNTLYSLTSPILTGAFLLAVFLLYWYHKAKKQLVKKARTKPHDLVPTAGTLVDRIVGRRELTQVIAQTLRDRRTRRPYLLVGGVGVGKTAVLVELTRMLAQQSAVPVPLRLRDMDGDGELDFEKMARRRFAEEADQGVFASGNIDKAWRQLRLDDKAVVIADGLEEALLDDRYREDRDNIIRRAIDRADRQNLPVVIASRPHAPLEGTRAAITALEPLSGEAALEYLVREPGQADERRLDWVVETAEVTDSPIYLRIARLLQQRGLLEHLTLREQNGRLNTRSNDCSTIRLWLIDTYRQAMENGLVCDQLVMDRKERRETLWVVSALACLGLVQDSIEVSFDDFVGAYLNDLRGPAGSREHPGEPAAGGGRDVLRPAVSPAQRQAIWSVLGRKVGESSSWTDPLEYPNECYTELARYAANAQLLGLVRGYENKVRFPHSIIQAYLGYRLLSEVEADGVAAVVEPALHSPGPSRELLIALVLLSRHRAEPPSPQPAVRPDQGRSRHLLRSRRTPPGLAGLLREAAANRHDAKYFDLYAAALEIDSVDPAPIQEELARDLDEQWADLDTKGDQRTVEDAKLGLVRRFGAALRERERRRGESGPLPGKAPARPHLPYERLFRIGTNETSHPVRTAIAHQLAAGGDAAFQSLRPWFPLGTDPVEQYLARTSEAKRKLNDDYTAWLEEANAGDAADPRAAAWRQQKHDRFVREYEQRRTTQWRHFALRAWLVPMFLGSVSDTYRDEAKERLNLWLGHLATPAGRTDALLPSAGPGEPDLPLSLENAMAQGFKNAANRRRRHPDVHEETRAHLMRQAERMLVSSRSWYAQLSLLHALCLWELPDTVGGAARPGAAEDRHRATTPAAGSAPDVSTAAGAPVEPVRTVTRWLAIAGSTHGTAAAGRAHDRHLGEVLHPFVAEAGDLVTLALETGHPEQFLWTDEHSAIDNVGSTPADPERYRKHNLWIAPSSGWSSLHPRAQRLLADVLIMLNLTERDGSPDDIEERLDRANRDALPPCLTHDRGPLHPERSVGRADRGGPGSTCLPTCKFRLCPYPPKAGKAQTEIEEPFCRQQQALLHSRSRWHVPVLTRRTAPWVSIPVKELHAFWEVMADRNRKSPERDEQSL